MIIRYYIAGIGYDENGCVTDYEVSFGDFDSYEEAYSLFKELQDRDDKTFFVNENGVHELLIQLEECEELDEEINCVDVKNEYWIANPYR